MFSKESLRRTISNDAPMQAFIGKAKHVDSLVDRLCRCLRFNDKAFKWALYISLPCGVLGFIISMIGHYTEVTLAFFGFPISIAPAAWSGVTSLVAFLVVFRCSQAYGRYWDALTSAERMSHEWYDCYSNACSFCSPSEEEIRAEKVREFKHLLARLFSMCHLSALLNLCETSAKDQELIEQFEILDPFVIDDDSMHTYCREVSWEQVDLVLQWIKTSLVQAVRDEVIVAPAPVVTSCFTQLSNGIRLYHDALTVADIPFPPQYQHACDVLLCVHWLITPFVTSLWVNSPVCVFIFTFATVFFLWSLSFVSTNIENPFGLKKFLVDAVRLQNMLCLKLQHLLEPGKQRVPVISLASDNDSGGTVSTSMVVSSSNDSIIPELLTLKQYFGMRKRLHSQSSREGLRPSVFVSHSPRKVDRELTASRSDPARSDSNPSLGKSFSLRTSMMKMVTQSSSSREHPCIANASLDAIELEVDSEQRRTSMPEEIYLPDDSNYFNSRLGRSDAYSKHSIYSVRSTHSSSPVTPKKSTQSNCGSTAGYESESDWPMIASSSNLTLALPKGAIRL